MLVDDNRSRTTLCRITSTKINHRLKPLSRILRQSWQTEWSSLICMGQVVRNHLHGLKCTRKTGSSNHKRNYVKSTSTRETVVAEFHRDQFFQMRTQMASRKKQTNKRTLTTTSTKIVHMATINSLSLSSKLLRIASSTTSEQSDGTCLRNWMTTSKSRTWSNSRLMHSNHL